MKIFHLSTIRKCLHFLDHYSKRTLRPLNMEMVSLKKLFAQSNKRNYHTEAMAHIINFLAVWPLATRKLLNNNCSKSESQRCCG